MVRRMLILSSITRDRSPANLFTIRKTLPLYLLLVLRYIVL